MLIDLPQESIEEFKRIWKKEFGEDITNDEAKTRAVNLINTYALVLLPESPLTREKEPEFSDTSPSPAPSPAPPPIPGPTPVPVTIVSGSKKRHRVDSIFARKP